MHRVLLVGLAGCWTGPAAIAPEPALASSQLVVRRAMPGEYINASCPVSGSRAAAFYLPLIEYAVVHLVGEVDHFGLGDDAPISIRYLPADGSTLSPQGLSIAVDPRSRVGKIHIENAWPRGSAWIDWCVYVEANVLVIKELSAASVSASFGM